ncbi:hypothetical protein G7Y89_g14936 [Cudoniella acicularis]|uniref:Uncharacterized protein n=1 Tax=Cudoniella acicularis TaxID=354080 RepID=A0A8H4QXZ8_9HELO|nr:hypothetical protein G7Y89_g14936 [Cudoniella acicularis]
MEMTDLEATKEKPDNKYRVPRISLKGYVGNFFSRNATYQVMFWPHSFQKPGVSCVSVPPTEKPFRNQDNFQRIYKGRTADDRYINPDNGRLDHLIVQCTDRVYSGRRNSTYKRTFIRNVSPKTLRVANWPMSHLDYGPRKNKPLGYFLMVVKWPLTCIALYIIIGLPGVASTGDVINDGGFDAFVYRYWGICKITRNAVETNNKTLTEISQSEDDETDETKMPNNRILEPRKLCFLTGRTAPLLDPDNPGLEAEMGLPMLVSEWKAQNQDIHNGKCPDYVFIAYTTEHFNHSDTHAIRVLHALAARATREVGLEAYWIGVSCMQTKTQSLQGHQEDVFRISDVVRGAYSLAVIVGPGERDPTNEAPTEFLLQHWGERMWTLPEALLSTPHRPIQVWRRGYPDPLILSKTQLAALAWRDMASTRQLVDHYEGNLTLSRLELVIIGLQSVFSRKTTQYFRNKQ